VDDRAVLTAIILGLGGAYALAAFAVSWLRSTPQERERWKYRGRHAGSAALFPEAPADTEMRTVLRRRYIASVAAAGGGILLGAGAIRYVDVALGLVLFTIGMTVSVALRWPVLLGLRWGPYRGSRRR
jgi:hypothetical protein